MPLPLSVIVPARNAAGTLQTTLDALGRQTLPRESYEVLLVDDRSSDGTEMLIGRFPHVRLLRMPARGGSYAARNLGLDHARGAVIAFTDADCRPAADWLESGLSELEALGADLLGGHIDVPLHRLPSLAELLDVSQHLDQARLVERGFAVTANLLVRRAVFDRIGPFNGRLISSGSREFCLRARDDGFRLAYSGRTVVVHPPRTRAGQLVRKGFRLGVGRAQVELFGRGPAREVEPKRPQPGADLPRGARRYLRALINGPEIYGIDRVRSLGHDPTAGRRILMAVAGYLWIDLPRSMGYLATRLASVLPGARRGRDASRT
jgi:hypothetical protein